MTQSFSSSQFTPLLTPSSVAAIYTHPSDVTSDPTLTIAEKRTVLASWISDARAVENAPSLRRLDSGAVVEVDEILRALGLLDESAPDRRHRTRQPPSDRRRGVILRWLRRPPPRSNDNDDDPPPAPAGFGIPFRPKPLSPAHGERLERARELAGAVG